MKRQVLLIFTILYFSVNGYSQECGGGVLTLNIYTKNGEKAKKVSYEIFPVPEELFKKFNDSKNLNIGRIINDFSEQNLFKNEDLDDKLNTLLKYSKISKSGFFFDCMKFKTFEMEYFPVIVKISIEGKTVYILGNYFGGCDREANLIYNGYYIKLL